MMIPKRNLNRYSFEPSLDILLKGVFINYLKSENLSIYFATLNENIRQIVETNYSY